MGFWGIKVKPGKPYPYHYDSVPGKLHVTQATLGLGSSEEKSIIQCSVGHKSPIFLCALIPNQIESCPLNLEFESDDLVAFSVVGSRCIHLSGYFVADEGDAVIDDYESDCFGEDITETDSEDASEFDTEDEYDNDFSDDDYDMFQPSSIPNRGVVIKEIVEDEKPANANAQSREQKKNKSGDSKNDRTPQNQIVLKRDVQDSVLESEDEDGFPISTKNKSKSTSWKPEAEVATEHKNKKTVEDSKKRKVEDVDDKTSLKTQVESNDQDDKTERKKQKKKKKQKKLNKEENAQEINSDSHMAVGEQPEEVKSPNLEQTSLAGNKAQKRHSEERSPGDDVGLVNCESQSEEKKKKKKNKKKTKEIEGGDKVEKSVTAVGEQNKSNLVPEEADKVKSSQVRTYANGLIIEEVAMGKPDGKRATPGKQVSVHYIGKLKKNEKIFDSNAGRAPFKFRLGVGQVIKGWDVGVNGMRVGDKRRLTIPPSMGYGATGSAPKIPPNAWLVFDVELVDVR